MPKIRPKITAFFFKEDGAKTVLNLKRIFLFSGPIVLLSIFTMVVLSMREDSSFLRKSDKKIVQDGVKSQSGMSGANSYSPAVSKVLGSYNGSGEKQKGQRPKIASKLNFKAVQVISRENAGDPTKSVPIGTNMIGKTLTAIDTREQNQMIKILLPYGGNSRLGVEIEKGTVLFGQVNYSGKGNKVSIIISKGLTPNEREFAIDAQVLDPSNYSAGLVGESNSQADVRIFSALGLAVASGASEIMMERENANALGQTMPQANLRNAALQGVSTSSQQEASRKTDKSKDRDDYITLPAGRDVIVTLTKSFVEK